MGHFPGLRGSHLREVKKRKRNPDFIGILLAGGQPSRADPERVYWPFRGGLLIDHMMGILDSCEPRYVVVSGRDGARGSVPDRWIGLGPVAGIGSVIEELTETPELVLVMPIDMPLLTKELVDELLLEASENPEVEAFHFVGQELPLLLRVNPRVRASIKKLMDQKTPASDRSIRALTSLLAARSLPVSRANSWAFLNAHSLADLEVLMKREG